VISSLRDEDCVCLPDYFDAMLIPLPGSPCHPFESGVSKLSNKEITDEYREYCKGIDKAPISLDSGDFATVLETWQNQPS